MNLAEVHRALISLCWVASLQTDYRGVVASRTQEVKLRCMSYLSAVVRIHFVGGRTGSCRTLEVCHPELVDPGLELVMKAGRVVAVAGKREVAVERQGRAGLVVQAGKVEVG